ncbi:unnamed protein product [Phytomonas sp. Hart1]|nr:unnamed protein product [Phytomonas sp. Hart1]|eukprot:CCW68152.1 unnamed protein product [Phytomonas sp. isolate Hart1]
MEPVVFRDDDKRLHNIAIDPDILGPLGLGFKMPVETTKGDGSIIGIENNNVCVLLDSNRTKQVITIFPLQEVGAAVRLLHETYPEHRLKAVLFRGHRVKIATQSTQGPCPVLALFNALMLSHKMQASYFSDYSITSRELIKGLASYLFCSQSTTLAYGPAISEGQSNCLSNVYGKDSTYKGTKSNGTDEINFASMNTNVESTRLPFSPVLTLSKIVRNPSTLQLVRESLTRTQEQVIALLDRLYSGMNINPIFTDCEGFVADSDVSLFALAGIRLLHGWVISPGSLYAPLRNMSFNELTTLAASSPPLAPLISSNSPNSSFSLNGTLSTGALKYEDFALPELPQHTSTIHAVELQEENKGDVEDTASIKEGVSDSLTVKSREFYTLAKSFYEATNSAQMTPEGYAELRESVKEGEVAVIFWRNHFFSCVKLQDRLLALCSDDSFADKPSIVFSVISQNMEEDGFTDADGVDVDPTVRYVQAVAGDQFSETVIRAAKRKLQQLHPMQREDPKAVADYLLEDRKRAGRLLEGVNHIRNRQQQLLIQSTNETQSPHPNTECTSSIGNQLQPHQSAASNGNTEVSFAHADTVYPSIASIISHFKDIFPQVNNEMAKKYILKHGGNLERAVNAYMCA